MICFIHDFSILKNSFIENYNNLQSLFNYLLISLFYIEFYDSIICYFLFNFIIYNDNNIFKNNIHQL